MTEEKTSLSKEEQDMIKEIINHAYGNEDLIVQPCDECGSIECAICSVDVLKLMQKTFQKGKEIGRKEETISSRENFLRQREAFKKSLDSEDIDLSKFWTGGNDRQKLAYIRGYFKRNFGIILTNQQDWFVLCFVLDCMSAAQDYQTKYEYSKVAELEKENQELNSLLKMSLILICFQIILIHVHRG